jgi:CheY-like chemotaxis protein
MILLVDDDHQVRRTLRGVLEKAGWETTEAANGQDAYRLLGGGYRPRLILLDLYMPVLDGNELLRKLQEMEIDVPVLMLTGCPDDLRPELRSRVVRVLEKPIEAEKLIKAIEEFAPRSEKQPSP